MNEADLIKLNSHYKAGDTAASRQVKALLWQADSLLTQGPWSVTYQKSRIAPSGDKHDYLSQAPYWWPDSTKANGKPYIRRDGQRNPEIYQLHDASQMEQMATAVKKLALANYFSPDKKYIIKAKDILKTWFLDPKTAMNPSLTYAQYVPGVNDGRGIGIIETVRLLPVPDAVTLLQPKLNRQVTEGVKRWFKSYTTWLITSKNGIDESKEKNNHGTWYDVQVVTYAKFYGDAGLSSRQLKEHTLARISGQFTPDGRQPLELARTRSWDYSNMNLLAWARLAFIAHQLNIGLWHYEQGGKGIKNTIAYLLPYAAGDKAWPYQEIGNYDYNNLKRVIHMARQVYRDLDLKSFDAKFPEEGLLLYLL